MGLLEYESCSNIDMLCLAKLYSVQVGGCSPDKLKDLSKTGIPDESFSAIVLPLIRDIRESIVFDSAEQEPNYNKISFDEIIALQERTKTDQDTKTAFKIISDLFRDVGTSRSTWHLVSRVVKPLAKEPDRIKKWLVDNNSVIQEWIRVVLFEEYHWQKNTYTDPEAVRKRIAAIEKPSRPLYWNDNPEDFIIYNISKNND